MSTGKEHPNDDDYFTATSEDDKLKIVIEFITEENHLEDNPFDYQWIDNQLVVASLYDGEFGPATKLVTFTRKELLDWYARALEIWGEFGGVCRNYSWGLAFHESEEPQKAV